MPMERSFSIIIPSWNNLGFLKLCVESIRKNSACRHQIIVHVNEGSDGTLDWVRAQGLDYTWSERNLGVCLAANSMRSKVKTDYIFYLNDDMYLLPGWDKALWDEIARLPDNRFFLSGTMIQPHNRLDVGILANYGDSLETFEEERLLREYMSYPKEDWLGATWPPNLLHRDVWDLVGGYSIEYTPGMYSDPDLSAKLWMAGVRHFKGLGACRAYHFETKTTGRIKKNDGAMQFMFKWGITNATFRRHCTRLGETATEEGRPHSCNTKALGRQGFRAHLKSCFKLLTGSRLGPAQPLYDQPDGGICNSPVEDKRKVENWKQNP